MSNLEHKLLQILRTQRHVPSATLLAQLGVSRATLMRAIRAAGAGVVARGLARRTTYAARRQLRGSSTPIPLYCVDRNGAGAEIGEIDLLHPEGCAIALQASLPWPLPNEMADGWFDGMPYFLDDMRPQGFLGRQFALRHAEDLRVPESPNEWGEDDAWHALSLHGSDQSGHYILGETAYRRFLADVQNEPQFLNDGEVEDAYAARAGIAMADGTPGSSAAGEFPKFTARRLLNGELHHVIVKFSGADVSPGSQRWSDLLVCEHLASRILPAELGIDAARSRIYRAAGRTFLEVVRFDRHGAFGRSPVCSWASLNAGVIGLAGDPWPKGAARLQQHGWLDAHAVGTVEKIWHFGRLISNTDMHDGNLSFVPGLAVAPVYDMLPMAYAPQRGVEIVDREYLPLLPLPSEAPAWTSAARAATTFWQQAAGDKRISAPFRAICRNNAKKLETLRSNIALSG